MESQRDEETGKQAEKGLEEIKDAEQNLDAIREQLVKLTAEFKKSQLELNEEIYNHGKDDFSDVNMDDLLTKGEAFHEGSIFKCKFKIKTLTKGESLQIDKMAKEYDGEANEYFLSSGEIDILAFILVEYNEIKATAGFEAQRKAVKTLSDDVLRVIWRTYSRMSSWIRANLEINLKN